MSLIAFLELNIAIILLIPTLSLDIILSRYKIENKLFNAAIGIAFPSFINGILYTIGL